MCVTSVWEKKLGLFFVCRESVKKKNALLGWITILFFRNDRKMNASVEEFLAMEFIYIVTLSTNS